MADITIYTTPSCHYCHMAKEYFKNNGIEYKEHDVSQDNEAREEMVEKSGQMGVPVIIINGEIVVGFDQRRVEELIGNEK